MALPVGIDLGTTNTVVSVFRHGALETIPIDGRPTLPSVVSLLPGGETLVGKAAKSRLLIAPEETVMSVKRHMGDRSKFFDIRGRRYSPIDISAAILRKAIDAAGAHLGEKVTRAVITVPAYFTIDQNADTMRAAEAAGIDVLRLLKEPTAAAIAYGYEQKKQQTLFVFDLGGGTFDVSILQVNGNDFDVKAVSGDMNLGGDNFDEILRIWAWQRFAEDNRLDLSRVSEADRRRAQQRLLEAAEKAKIELSDSLDAVISIPDFLEGRSLEYPITRDQYNALIKDTLDRAGVCITKVLADAAAADRTLTRDAIDRVILVGGSTRNRAVHDLVTKLLKEPYRSARVDEMVAMGAALVAANLDTVVPQTGKRAVDDIVFHDVTAHSVGIDAIGPGDTVVFHPLIPRQTRYPVRRGFVGTTNHKMQSVVVMKVYMGEDTNPENNHYLGVLELPVQPQFKIVLVGAVFHLDENDVIEFTAVEIPDGPEANVILDHARTYGNDLYLEPLDRLIASGRVKPIKTTIKMAKPGE